MRKRKMRKRRKLLRLRTKGTRNGRWWFFRRKSDGYRKRKMTSRDGNCDEPLTSSAEVHRDVTWDRSRGARSIDRSIGPTDLVRGSWDSSLARRKDRARWRNGSSDGTLSRAGTTTRAVAATTKLFCYSL